MFITQRVSKPGLIRTHRIGVSYFSPGCPYFAKAEPIRHRTEGIAEYKTGRADFADYLIGQKNQVAGCKTSVTFDRSLESAESFSQADR